MGPTPGRNVKQGRHMAVSIDTNESGSRGALGRLWKKRWFRVVSCLFGLYVLGGVAQVVSKANRTPEPTQQTSAGWPSSIPQTAASAAESAQDERARSIALLASDRDALGEIEKLYQFNQSKLAGNYYAGTSAVTKATESVSQLEAIAGRALATGDKSDAKTASRAKSLAGKMSVQVRQMYASATEESFMKDGMDISVTASGAMKDQLRLKFALMSQPLIYKLQNEVDLPKVARSLGFRKIVYTNGFEGSMGNTWTVDL
jgi:hypothetical protein